MSDYDYVPIMIVNEQDEPVGSAQMNEAYENGLIHRVVFVIVENTNGDILLQKRGSNVATYPNCWDVSAAGHVDEGEDYETAAKRELSEELGLHGIALQSLETYRGDVTYNGKKLYRFIKVYKAIVPTNTAIKINDQELAAIKWVKQSEFKQFIENQTACVANGLAETFEKYYA